MKLVYRGFKQAAFLCPEKTCFKSCIGGFQGASEGNFRGGRKPSAFESEIHPSHKTSFCTLGISPCRGQIHASVNLSMLPKGRAHGWHCCLWLHFVVDMRHRLWDFTERSLFAAVRKRQTWNARTQASVLNQPSYNCCPQKVLAVDYPPKEGRKYL